MFCSLNRLVVSGVLAALSFIPFSPLFAHGGGHGGGGHGGGRGGGGRGWHGGHGRGRGEWHGGHGGWHGRRGGWHGRRGWHGHYHNHYNVYGYYGPGYGSYGWGGYDPYFYGYPTYYASYPTYYYSYPATTVYLNDSGYPGGDNTSYQGYGYPANAQGGQQNPSAGASATSGSGNYQGVNSSSGMYYEDYLKQTQAEAD